MPSAKSPKPLLRHAHALPLADVLSHWSVSLKSGLNTASVTLQRAHFGRNELPETQNRSAWRVFLAQFFNALILVLLGAALLSALIGHTTDAVIIFGVILINALVGFYQEYRAEQSLLALKAMLPPQACVRREGCHTQIDASDIVPGDVVVLEAGDRVPADGRIALATGLEIDESTLTGESQPASKQVCDSLAHDAPLAERHNMAFMNTLLTRGRAEMIVTATGAHTETGQISTLLANSGEVATPLQRQLDQLGKKLGLIAVLMVVVLALLEWLRGIALTHIILSTIALGVAAIPEGLPVVVTVTLALGMHQMAKNGAIVKRLASVETLGCTTVICSDKTGTLTLNQMTARTLYYQQRHFTVGGEGYQTAGQITPLDNAAPPDLSRLATALRACNDSQLHDGKITGDPMEAALLVLAGKIPNAATSVPPRIAEIAFDNARRYMVTFHQDGDGITLYAKGAPDVLLDLCRYHDETQADPKTGSELIELDTRGREMIAQAYQNLATLGLRGLMLASRKMTSAEFAAQALPDHLHELTFLALVGLQDPPRCEAGEAIERCHSAGIAVKMITGDHQLTGMAIASQLGLSGHSMTGTELEALSEKELAAQVDDIAVFARASPLHKVKIINALQARGHIVAMTGDGVNDAPALKTADIGVAMGKHGSAVAKEAATMVLTDDNFSTIVAAVQQGRALYENILKFLHFQLSTTIGAVLTVFVAPLVGLPAPFTPIQILWIAIIMDGPPAISLALDPARANIMQQKPRDKAEPVLTRARLIRVLACGATMMAGTLGVLHYGLTGRVLEEFTPDDTQRAATMAFTTFVLFQFFNVFNARNERSSALNRDLFSNTMLWLSLSCVLALQAIAVHWPPAQALFATHGMLWSDWPLCIAVASSIWLLEEARKYLFRIR
ncbi:cation-translocating P-type ATPase [Chitinibacter sp. S2-10]|uniref:cation-translocating P-type ATPase n=1 Tax=Chitinibacter sp. S2-10 TaxID=3373597 RepID=UPI003977B335